MYWMVRSVLLGRDNSSESLSAVQQQVAECDRWRRQD